jgi:hypothetical protein
MNDYQKLISRHNRFIVYKNEKYLFIAFDLYDWSKEINIQFENDRIRELINKNNFFFGTIDNMYQLEKFGIFNNTVTFRHQSHYFQINFPDDLQPENNFISIYKKSANDAKISEGMILLDTLFFSKKKKEKSNLCNKILNHDTNLHFIKVLNIPEYLLKINGTNTLIYINRNNLQYNHPDNKWKVYFCEDDQCKIDDVIEIDRIKDNDAMYMLTKGSTRLKTNSGAIINLPNGGTWLYNKKRVTKLDPEYLHGLKISDELKNIITNDSNNLIPKSYLSLFYS